MGTEQESQLVWSTTLTLLEKRCPYVIAVWLGLCRCVSRYQDTVDGRWQDPRSLMCEIQPTAYVCQEEKIERETNKFPAAACFRFRWDGDTADGRHGPLERAFSLIPVLLQI